MHTTDLSGVLVRLFSELADGASDSSGAFILNSGDVGLLASLEKVSADDASRSVNDGATIAAHAQHLRYGLSLMNRWAGGDENAFANADWNASWQRTEVTDEEWRTLRERFAREAAAWQKIVESRTEWDDISASGALSSAAHTAYHLGAIRQILASMEK